MRIFLVGIGLHHKDAADSHCKFVVDLVKKLKLDCQSNSFSAVNPEQVDSNEYKVIRFFMDQGPHILGKYFSEILDTPPSSVIDYYIDSVTEICYSFLPESKEWMISTLQGIPINVYTDDEKNRMVK